MKAFFSSKHLCALAASVVISVNAADAGQEFHPGEIWRDTDGKPINAHGGGVLGNEGVYYWYGEVKSGRTVMPESNKSWGGTGVAMGGVSCYSSTNLLDWRNEGIVLQPAPDDPTSDLHPSKVLERPKVIYNRRTKQFVMWMHVDSADYAAARCGVATSDKPTGPFKYLGSFRPDAGVWPENITGDDQKPGTKNALERDFKTGQMARDLTVFVDDDGKAYLFYASEDNAAMHVSLLTDDYLHTAGKYARIFVGRSMEAPTVFKNGGKYHFIGSGCSGWDPNAARSAVADRPFGPWTEQGNPCTGSDAEKTFHSQGTFVLPVQGRPDQFIFMADHWEKWDLSSSTYLWLPLERQLNGTFGLRWRKDWGLPLFQDGLNKASTRLN
jgi:beta-xylosidase